MSHAALASRFIELFAAYFARTTAMRARLDGSAQEKNGDPSGN